MSHFILARGAVAALLLQIYLVQSLVVMLLVPDAFSNQPTFRLTEKCYPTKFLVPVPYTRANPRQVDCTRPLDLPNHLRGRILQQDRDHHVHAIGHPVPFLNPTLFLLLRGQTAQPFSQMASHLFVTCSPAIYWNENLMLFALPFRMS